MQFDLVSDDAARVSRMLGCHSNDDRQQLILSMVVCHHSDDDDDAGQYQFLCQSRLAFRPRDASVTDS